LDAKLAEQQMIGKGQGNISPLQEIKGLQSPPVDNVSATLTRQIESYEQSIVDHGLAPTVVMPVTTKNNIINLNELFLSQKQQNKKRIQSKLQHQYQ